LNFRESQPVLRPLDLILRPHGVVFAESVHDRSFRMDTRTDEFAKILFVIRGTIRVEWQDGRSLSAGEGSFVAIEHKEPHRIRDLSPSTLFLLCLRPDLIEENPTRRQLWSHIGAVNGQCARIAGNSPGSAFDRLWRTALLEQHAEPSGHELSVRACADQILVHLARLRVEAGDAGPAERVARVVRELETTFHDAWYIEKARAHAGLSRHYFTRLFRQATGMSFLEKLTTLRLEHAAHLLTRGGHSIAGVAFACGFTDLSHFYRVFRARFKCPPGRYADRRSDL
jgi:AraC-like DNA-binding protein